MNVALIEFNTFHDECLYSQVRFIKTVKKAKVFLVLNYHLKERVSYWDLIDDALFIGSNQWGIGYLRILNFLRRNKIDKCVFNSTHYASTSRLLALMNSRSADYYGLVHNRKNFKTKQTFQLNRKLKGYFLLNDYLLDGIEQFDLHGAVATSFYPIFFPPQQSVNIVKPQDELWIIIPGLLESGRRDYARLAESLSRHKLKQSIKLIFLGKSVFKKGQVSASRLQLEASGQKENMLFWDRFIDNGSFQRYLELGDYILPLIHKGHRTIEEYKNKITGSFNLGFGFKKIFVMDSWFEQFDDFRNNGFFYSADDDLVDVLNSLEKPIDSYQIIEKWNFDFQAKNYLEFIGVSG